MPQTIPPASAISRATFHARPATVEACLAHLRATLPGLETDLHLVTAGGTAFRDQMPDAPVIEASDFPGWRPETTDQRIAVVGHPPFGRNGALAIRIFNTAAAYAEVIAMILPASFGKASMQNRLDPSFQLVSDLALPGELFRVDGALRPVNAVFQVWRRGTGDRPRIERPVTHADFRFVTSPAEADLVLRRVGRRAGTLLPRSAEPEARGYSPSSNFFLKAEGVDPARLEARVRALDFGDLRRQAAHPSVSKSDLVALYAAQAQLDRVISAARETVRVEARLVDSPFRFPLHLPRPSAAREGEVVAIIGRQRLDRTTGQTRPELAHFRGRQGEAFAPVLHTMLEGEFRRSADILLHHLFARKGPWGDDVSCERTTVLFREALFCLERRPGATAVLRLELFATGRPWEDGDDGDEEGLATLARTYFDLGRDWLAELGEGAPQVELPAPVLRQALRPARPRRKV